MPLSSTSKITILSAVLFAFSLVILWLLLNNDQKPASLANNTGMAQSGYSHAQSMKGLSYSSYDDSSNLIVRFQADEFRVDQRRLWVFNVRPFKEARINNARIELFLDKGEGADADIFSSAERFLSLNSSGRAGGGRDLISKGVVNGMSFSVTSVDGLIKVEAEKAYLDLRKKRMKLLKASIDDLVGNRIIKSDMVFWNDMDKSFEVPGEYAETVNGRVSAGNGLIIKIKKL